MANFVPLKQYMLYCLDRFVVGYGLTDPFLEVGCGRGDVSAHLAAKGWRGAAIDFSDAAIARATETLRPYPGVTVARTALSDVDGTFATVIAWDVLEHIEDDDGALAAIARRLAPGGHLLLAVPSNPREWRWDDDFYGHQRRYTEASLSEKLSRAGLQPVAFRDFTFPAFWAMRRVYTRFKRAPRIDADRTAATMASATVNAWDVPLVSRMLDASAALWRPLHRLQFAAFGGATGRGHEFFALAQKPR